VLEVLFGPLVLRASPGAACRSAAAFAVFSASVCISPFLLRVPAGFSLGKGRTPWEAKVVLSSRLYTCCAIHRSVPRTRFSDSQKLGFRFTEF
jgi:hypothetical protein